MHQLEKSVQAASTYYGRQAQQQQPRTCTGRSGGQTQSPKSVRGVYKLTRLTLSCPTTWSFRRSKICWGVRMGPPLKLTALAEWLLEPPYSGTAFRGWF